MAELIKTDDKLNELEKSMNEALIELSGEEPVKDAIDEMFKARGKKVEPEPEDDDYEDDDEEEYEDDDMEKSQLMDLDEFQKSVITAMQNWSKDFEKSYSKKIKSLEAENAALKKSLSTFLKSQREYTQELRKSVDIIGNTPIMRKSISGIEYQDRLFSYNDGNGEQSLTKSEAKIKLAELSKSLDFKTVSKLEDKINLGQELTRAEYDLLVGGK